MCFTKREEEGGIYFNEASRSELYIMSVQEGEGGTRGFVDKETAWPFLFFFFLFSYYDIPSSRLCFMFSIDL
jgi:hypothetical protein